MGPARIRDATRMPRAARAGWFSVLVGLIGISAGGTLTVLANAQAQDAPQPVVRAAAEECSTSVTYDVTSPNGVGNPSVGVWWRVGDVGSFEPSPDPGVESPSTVDALAPERGYKFSGTIDTGAEPGSTITLRVEPLAPWDDGAAAGGAVWTTAQLPPSCDAPAPPETAPPSSAPPAGDAPATPVGAPDDDGVDAQVEAGAPNGGDGNGDGIADAEQANVASLPSAYDVDLNGAVDDYVTIESPAETQLHKVRTLTIPADNPPPEGVELPAGLIDYDVEVVEPGDRADVRLFLPGGEQSSVYMLQHGKWKVFDAHASIDDAADQVTLRLADGGAGDESDTDGVINDPVGIAQPLTPPPPEAAQTFVVRTDNVPEPGIAFTYDLQDCGNGGAPVCSGPVTTSTPVADGGEFTFTGLTLDHWYQVTRQSNTGWSVASIQCLPSTAPTPVVNTADRTGAVKITAASGGACTFTNAKTGTVTFIKQTAPNAGSPKQFSSTLRRCGDSDDSSCDAGDTLVGPSQLVRGNETVTFDLTQNGRYFVNETAAPGWTLSSRSCTGTTASGDNPSDHSIGTPTQIGVRFFVSNFAQQSVVCTFTNTQAQPAANTITVRKQTVPVGSSQAFTLQVRQCTGTNTGGGAISSTNPNSVVSGSNCTDGNSTQLGGGTFQLRDDGDFVTLTLSSTTNRWYRITETIPSGWTLTGRDCTGGFNESTGNPATTVSYFVAVGPDAGAQIDCTFVNTAGSDGTGTITVNKGGTRNGTGGNGLTYATALAGASFEYSADGLTWQPLPGCSPAASAECTSSAVAAGSYFVRESAAPTDWNVIPSLAYGGTSSGQNNQTLPYQGTVTVVPGQANEVSVTINNTGTQNVPHRFVNRLENNDFPNTCGLSLSLILDESGSIGNQAPQYAAAANSFIDSLAGSPTTVYISSFSDNAASVPNSPFDLSDPDSPTTGPEGATTAITNVYATVGGSTNWDEGLRETVGNGTDVTIILTDGNPTTWDGTPVDGGGAILLNELEAGIASANSVKDAGAKLLAVGVGSGVTPLNLEALSGPGDFYVTDVQDLEDTLSAIANQLCGARVHVRKLVGGVLTDGWQFTGTSSVQSAPVSYPNGQVTGQGGNPSGEMQININNVPAPPGGTDVTVSETAQPGYAFADGQCRMGGNPDDPYNTGAVVGSVGTDPVATLPAVQRNQDIYCTFNNAPETATVNVVKLVDGVQTAGWTVDGSVVDPGNEPVRFTAPNPTNDGEDASGDTLVDGVLPFTLTTVADGSALHFEEQLQPGYAAGAVECSADGQPDQDGTAGAVDLTVDTGETWTCTFNNSANTATVRVEKFVGDVRSAGWTIDGSVVDPAGDPVRFDPGATHTASGDTIDPGFLEFDLTTVTDGSALHFEETLQAGYTAGAVECTADGQDPQDGIAGEVDLAVDPGETWTCRFNNSTADATVKVVKLVDGVQTAGWTIDGSVVDPDNDPVRFTAPNPTNDGEDASGETLENVDLEFDLTTVTDDSALHFEETLQDGYTAGAVECTADGQDPQDGTAGEVDLTVGPGETWTCTFNNSADIATVNIVKLVDGVQTAGWTINGAIDDPENDPARFTAPNPTNDGEDASGETLENANLEFDLTTVTDDSALHFEEELQPGYTAGSVQCTADNQDPQDGIEGEVDLDIAPGQVWTCTFNNTLNTATVTVIKEIDDAPQPGWTFDGTIGPDGPAVFADTDPPSKEQSQTTAGDPAEAVFGIELVPADGTDVTITEQPQPGFVPVGLECTVNSQPVEQADDQVAVVEVNTGDEVVCTFENREAPGTITIAKETIPASTQDFDFTTTELDPAEFTLADDGSREFEGLIPGTYRVTETDPAALGWRLDSIVCEGDTQPVIDVPSGTVTIDLDVDESVLCTYTNVPNTATVNVVKLVDGVQTAGWTIDGSVVDPDDGAARFTAPNPTNDGEDASGETLENANLEFDLTTVTDGSALHFEETLQPGFTAGSVECTADGQDDQDGTAGAVDVDVAPGEIWTCTFNNTLNTATVEVRKQVAGAIVPDWTFDGTLPADPPAVQFEGGGKAQQHTTAGDPATATWVIEEIPADGVSVNLAEVLQEGYSFGGVTCAVIPEIGAPVPISTGDAPEGAAAPDVLPGQLVRCTFVNNFLPASISLVKTANETSVNAGNNASFTILVTNDGQVPLTNVVVTDPVPTGTSFVAASVEAGNPGSCGEAAAVITCTLEDPFEIGETSTIRVVVNVPGATSLTSVVNVATVTGDPPVCPPAAEEIGVLATGCPVTSTDDATVPVIVVGGEVVTVDAPRVIAGTLPFTGPPGAAALKSGAWLLALGGIIQLTTRRRRGTTTR